MANEKTGYEEEIRREAFRCALFGSWWRRAWFQLRHGVSAPRDLTEWLAHYAPVDGGGR